MPPCLIKVLWTSCSVSRVRYIGWEGKIRSGDKRWDKKILLCQFSFSEKKNICCHIRFYTVVPYNTCVWLALPPRLIYTSNLIQNQNQMSTWEKQIGDAQTIPPHPTTTPNNALKQKYYVFFMSPHISITPLCFSVVSFSWRHALSLSHSTPPKIIKLRSRALRLCQFIYSYVNEKREG